MPNIASKIKVSNVQKITSAENLRSRAFDDLAIEFNINCNRQIAEVIFLTLLNLELHKSLDDFTLQTNRFNSLSIIKNKMNIEIRDARKQDVEIVAWTVLTALDMETDEIDKFIRSCSEEDSIYSWRNSIVATVDGKAVGCLIAYEGSRYKELKNKSWIQLWDDMNLEYLKTIEAETVDGEFYLDSMAILPEYRGYSIGKNASDVCRRKGGKNGMPLLYPLS